MTRTHRGAGGRRSGTSSRLSVSVMADRISRSRWPVPFRFEARTRPREGSIHGPAWMDPSPVWARPSSGCAYPCHATDGPVPRTGDPSRGGAHLSLDGCPPPSAGCRRSRAILHGRSVTPSRGGEHPYGVMGAANRHDRCPRSPKGPSLWARRTSIGLKEAAKWHEGCTHPADRGHPSGLMAAGKPAPGIPMGPEAVAMRPDGHRRAGTRDHPFAGRGHPWALMGTRKRREGRVARGKASDHRVASIPGNDGKVHRFEGRARPSPSSTRRSAGGLQRSPKKAATLGALRYRHRREGRTRSPRCATRSERWAAGSAVKGRPLSGEGRERQGQRPGDARQVPGRRHVSSSRAVLTDA